MYFLRLTAVQQETWPELSFFPTTLLIHCLIHLVNHYEERLLQLKKTALSENRVPRMFILSSSSPLNVRHLFCDLPSQITKMGPGWNHVKSSMVPPWYPHGQWLVQNMGKSMGNQWEIRDPAPRSIALLGSLSCHELLQPADGCRDGCRDTATPWWWHSA